MSRSGLYNIAGALARTAVALATIPLLIRSAGLEEFGVWTLAAALIGLFAIAESALNITTTVQVSRDRAANDDTGLSRTLTLLFTLALGFSVVLALALFLSAETVAQYFPNLTQARRETLAAALQMGSIWLFARLLQQVALGVIQGSQRYGIMNLLLTAQSAGANAGMILIARQGGRTIEFVQCQAVAGAAGLIASSVVALIVLRHNAIKIAWDAKTSKAIGRYGGWTFLTTLGTVVFSQADRVVVGRILGASAEGVYAAITAVAAQINSLSAMPVQPLLPQANTFFTAETRRRGERIEFGTEVQIRKALWTSAVVALTLGAALVAFSGRILALILPAQSATAWGNTTAFQAAMVIYALYSMNATGYFLCLGFGAVRATAAIVLASSALTIGLIALGAHTMGVTGAVLGNAGYQVVWLLTFTAMRRARIPARTWMRWILAPLDWFSVSIAASMLIPSEAWRAAALAVTICGMFGRVAIFNKLWRLRCMFGGRLASFKLSDGSKFAYPADSIIGFALFNGTFESAELRFIRENLKPGGVFLDIGANAGIYSIIAAKSVGPGGRVVAFEPDSRNLELLRRNIELNQLSNVTVVSKAVSNTVGSSPLAISRDGAMSSLAQTNHATQIVEKWETVETTTLDAAIRALDVAHVDLIKIDVEGAEMLVFEGARETLEENRAALILFESADVAARSFQYGAKDVLLELQRMGFAIRCFDGRSLKPLDSFDDPRIGRDIYNFVASRG